MCPWLPRSFFETLLQAWAEQAGEEWELLVDLSSSGPSIQELAEGTDPLSLGRAEAGLICAPTYIWGVRNVPPRVELAGWTPVFEDTDKPIYHSVVLAPTEHPATSLEDLKGARWCFNDPCSLSGYFSVLSSLEGNDTKALRSRATFTGGHTQSVEAVLGGQADACAVDSNGWALQKELRARASGKLKKVTTLGPFPTQPIVFSKALSSERRTHLRESLEATANNPDVVERLAKEFNLVRFVPHSHADFREVEEFLSNRDSELSGTGERR